MALLIQGTKSEFLFADSTLSPDAFFDPTGPWSISLFYDEVSFISANRGILSYQNEADSSKVELVFTSLGSVRVITSDSDGPSNNRNITGLVDGLNHIVMTSPGSTAGGDGDLYLNGVRKLAFFEANMPNTPLTLFQLGRTVGDDDSPDMNIAEYRVYDNDELTLSQIQDLFGSGTRTRGQEATAATATYYLPLENNVIPLIGSSKIGSGNAPSYVDDSAIFGSFTPSPVNAIPTIVNGSRLVFGSNQDIMYIGDSFGIANDTTVPLHAFATALDILNVPLLKAADGLKLITGAQGGIFNLTNMLIDGTRIRIDANNPIANPLSYENDPGDTKQFMALPVRSAYEHRAVNPETATLAWADFAVQALDETIFGTKFSEFMIANSEIGLVILTYQSSVDPVVSIEIVDQLTGTINSRTLGTNAGIFNPVAEVTLTSTSPTVRLARIRPPSGTFDGTVFDKYLTLSYAIAVNRQVTAGLGIGFLADNSYSYSNFSSDTTSTGSGAGLKNFTREQMEPVIRAFQDPSRKFSYAIQLATETDTENEINTLIAQLEAYHLDWGLPAPHSYILVAQMMHSIGSNKLHDLRVKIEQSLLDMKAVADANPKVVLINQYALTGGCFFHDGNNSDFQVSSTNNGNDADGPQQKFLDDYDATNGTVFAVTPGRVMLDASDLHPADVPSAQFFGQTVGTTYANTILTLSAGESPTLGLNLALKL